MASGRHSGDPTDLMLVDPSQPEATERARKHLTKWQKDIFIQYGFTKALLREVIAAGWDQVDINNYVLYYNSQVETKLAMPAPGLDMSMKKAINTVILTKLQEGLEEREIGVVTPANPKVPSTGEPREPDPGMLPPGPKRTTGGSKPALNPGQRSGSVKAIQAEVKKAIAKKRQKAKLLPDHVQPHQKNRVLHNRPPPKSERNSQQKPKTGSFLGPPHTPKVNRLKS